MNTNTFNYGKNLSIDIDVAIVTSIKKAFTAMNKAHSVYVAKDNDLREAMKQLVDVCFDKKLTRSQGGKVLAEMVGVKFLKDDRNLANAWQFVAKQVPTSADDFDGVDIEELKTKQPSKAVDTVTDADDGTNDLLIKLDVQKEYLAIAVAMQSNNIVTVADSMIALLTADQLDHLAKRFNDHIAQRTPMKSTHSKANVRRI